MGIICLVIKTLKHLILTFDIFQFRIHILFTNLMICLIT
jgi:hypothetical protein